MFETKIVNTELLSEGDSLDQTISFTKLFVDDNKEVHFVNSDGQDIDLLNLVNIENALEQACDGYQEQINDLGVIASDIETACDGYQIQINALNTVIDGYETVAAFSATLSDYSTTLQVDSYVAAAISNALVPYSTTAQVDAYVMANNNGKAPTQQILTSSSGTYIVPAGCLAINVVCVGGGAPGGGAPSTTAGTLGLGSGGGHGGIATKFISNPSSTYSYSVGVATPGSSGANGNNGTSTWFGTSTTVMAVGGAGGVMMAAGISAIPQIDNGPNIATQYGDFSACGGVGGWGWRVSSSLGYSGLGANCLYFGTGGGLAWNSAGSPGIGYGAGGGGALSVGSFGPFAGGAGSSGVIIVTEYY